MTICHGIPWCRNGADDHCPFIIEGWWLFFYPLSYLTLTDELLFHIRELVELENGVNFIGNAEIGIVLTEEELDGFITHIDEKCQKLYLGHDILMDAQQAQILKDKKITINIIPDYYYKELEG